MGRFCAVFGFRLFIEKLEYFLGCHGRIKGIGARIDGVVVIELALENKGKLTFNKPLMRKKLRSVRHGFLCINLDYHILSGGLVHCLGKKYLMAKGIAPGNRLIQQQDNQGIYHELHGYADYGGCDFVDFPCSIAHNPFLLSCPASS